MTPRPRTRLGERKPPVVAGCELGAARRYSPCVAVSKWYHPGMAFTLRTDGELDAALAALAEAEGLSHRRSSAEPCSNATNAPDTRASADHTDRMVERWGDVLDRLGSV